MSALHESPTQAQIEFVSAICAALEIKDFPSNSIEYSKYGYSRFISAHIDEFYNITGSDGADEDYLYMTCENDVWTEYY